MDRKELIEELVKRELDSAEEWAIRRIAEHYMAEQYEEMPNEQLRDILQSYEDIGGLFGGA
jgi:hypothetical protein